MATLAYYRVSSSDQSIASQRQALGGPFDHEFSDEGVSGAIMAKDRPGFGKLLGFIRKGDNLHIYAIDRLGRDALDVQATVRRLIEDGVTIHVHGLGTIGRGVGELIVAVLAQVADMERQRIRERCANGRATAKAYLEATGKTHNNKLSMGRPKRKDGKEVAAWRKLNSATLEQTCQQFSISRATASRYWAEFREQV